ncbi:MAG: SAM-dependent chlorinase/fluorinase [Methylotetracoccus sp.]|nr:SAM-dependent chlorinase/fluorinase [Methylotetracoccus sp.]
MIFLFTDFGAEGPYLGQVKAAIRSVAPDIDVIDLVSNAPNADPESSAYLLAALSSVLPVDCVVLGVIDPGVGGSRDPIVLHADGRWFVGPDNGLFNVVAVQASQIEWSVIDWRPERLSASFHGRDLFAPVAARIARHDFLWAQHRQPQPDLEDWPADRDRIIYFDTYGNAFTGRRYEDSLTGQRLLVNRCALPEGDTFCTVPGNTAFWYRNSIDLVEIAVNRGSAREALGLELGMPVRFID